jgi:Uma2 family endonuclease
MSAAAHHAIYSLEEYVQFEAGSNVKHEWFDGEIRAMSGGSPAHAAAAGQIITQLNNQLQGRCMVFTSDARVRVVATGLDTYPDVSVVCGPVQLDAIDPHAMTNPIVLIEVLSRNTERYDRGDKLAAYQQIESMREIVLVAHDRRSIELWRRDADTAWHALPPAADGTVELVSIRCALDVGAIYRVLLP